MTFSSILKRYYAVLPLSLIAVIAYLQARAVTFLVGMLLEASAPARASLAPTLAQPSEPKSGAPIAERNPFDSSLPSPSLAAPDLSDPLSWPACPNVEVSIVTQSSDPTWSLATLRLAGEPRARLGRMGDRLAERQVAFIGYDPRHQVPAVWLEGGAGSCQTALFASAAQLEARLSAAPAPEPSAFDVQRSTVESVARNPLGLLSGVRVVPEQKDGSVVGLRLFGVRPTSLLGSVGLRNGDRIETVNGFAVANPEQALLAYAKLRTAPRLDVHLTRAGKPVDLTLRID